MGLAKGAAPLASGPGVAGRLQALFPTGDAWSPTPSGPAGQQQQHLTGEEETALRAAIRRQILHAPRRSAADLAGGRFEHWSVLRHETGAVDAAVDVAVLFVKGALPAEFEAAQLGARMLPLTKKTGDIRPLACGGILRRLVAKTLCRVYKKQLREAGGPQQYAIGRRQGTELVHKAIAAAAEALGGAAVLALDAQNAYNTLSRPAVAEGLQAEAPFLADVARRWLGRTATVVGPDHPPCLLG